MILICQICISTNKELCVQARLKSLCVEAYLVVVFVFLFFLLNEWLIVK